MLANMWAKGLPQNTKDAYARAQGYGSGEQDRKVNLSREEPIEGGTAFYNEATKGCVMDANPTRTETIFGCDVRQGNTMVTIDGNFSGTAAEAKAMMLETLGKISKTNFQSLTKR